MLKKVKLSFEVKERHWVGDGFYVHGLLRPMPEINAFISPFILMDYASPHEFTKTNTPRGVGEHPHRGFETVTLAYQGEIAHRDSSGGGGVIKEGDVQWMTAGSGIVHDEFHSDAFAKKGGVFEMVQLWVNLPKKNKMTHPKYQDIENASIPKVSLGHESELRVIAGHFGNIRGPASTFTDINMYDVKSNDEDTLTMDFTVGSNTIVLIMSGEMHLENKKYSEKNAVLFERLGETLSFKSSKNFKALILNGMPINEPIVAHGPFVMNTKDEIIQAIQDFQAGKMGKL